MLTVIVVLILTLVASVWSEEICCQSSGDCFTDAPPFDSANWPLPECHQPTFLLWRKDMNGSREIARGNTPNEYNRSDDTVLLVHGWTSNGAGVDDLKDEFLQNQVPYNIIVVDWEDGASPLYYPQAASNVRVTGSEIADVIEELDPVYSWCVGHSLGAHCCGHAGNAGAYLHRITGLDPAGPNFDLPGCSANASVCRLDPTDAVQVDAIHTDGRVAGTMNLVGHVDFFPNGGVQIQPGCDDVTCSHLIAQTYFQESINNDCFLSTNHNCSDLTELPGSCSECGELECPNMGASTSFGEGIYYLETNPSSPYCQG